MKYYLSTSNQLLKHFENIQIFLGFVNINRATLIFKKKSTCLSCMQYICFSCNCYAGLDGVRLYGVIVPGQHDPERCHRYCFNLNGVREGFNKKKHSFYGIFQTLFSKKYPKLLKSL